MEFNSPKFLEQVFKDQTLLGPEDHFFNIRVDTMFDVEDAMNVARMITDPEGKAEHTYMLSWSTHFIAALMLHELYQNKRLVFQEASMQAMCKEFWTKPYKDMLGMMMTFPHIDVNSHPFVQAAAMNVFSQRSSDIKRLLKEVREYLRPWCVNLKK